MERIKLFCLSHAGGTAAVYNRWKKMLHDSIEIFPIDLNGRGKLYGKQQYKSFEEMINDVYNRIIKQCEKNDELILFGHSFGGLIVYEISNKMMSKKDKMPLHVFISGIRPPHYGYAEECVIDHLSDREFVAELQKLGGMPKEVLENKEILNYYIPIIRMDYKLLEEYSFIPGKKKLNCDLSVLYGSEEADKNKMGEWNLYTSKNFYLKKFEGNHFFVFDYDDAIVQMINQVAKVY